MSTKVWNRDLAMEARGKRNWMYRVGFLFGVLSTWVAVGTGIAPFVNVAVIAVVLVVGTTIWDLWKIWKGKTSVIS